MRIRGIKSEFYDNLTIPEKVKVLAVVNVLVGIAAGIAAIFT